MSPWAVQSTINTALPLTEHTGHCINTDNLINTSGLAVFDRSWMQGVVHGCPYKAFDANSVTAALSRLRIAPGKVRAAVDKMQGGHYQLACAAAWEGAHGCECITGINHPNQV